jgi:hypothetical protein
VKRETAITTTFIIERPRQIKLFQVRIPREVENIIGVEMGLNWTEGFPAGGFGGGHGMGWSLPLTLNRNISIGDLKLQSYEKANVFYSGELTLNQNVDNADFTSQFFQPQPYTHQAHAHEVDVKVSGSTTIIQGVFRDKLADTLPEAVYKYKVTLCLWTAAKIQDEQQ